MQITRENKLALVVGFALILFVGILISDHFSTARNQASADLAENRPIDPLVDVRRSDPNLLDFRPPPQPSSGSARPTPAHNTITREDERPAVPPRPESQHVEMGGQTFIVVDEPAPQDPPFIFHDVQRGESLSSISRRYYGDESLAAALAKFNNISDPNALRANHRLRIPAAEALTGGSAPASRSPSSTPSAPARADQPAHTTYTIKSGDSLSEVAQRLLGSSQRWREIHELNRDVISDPDNVQVGTVLKIPRR